MYKLLLLFLFSNTLIAQVGIGTTDPQAALDIDGDLRIRTISQETETGVIKDSILVISRTGIVNRVPAKDILKAAVPTAIKASLSSGGNLGLSLTSGGTLITFDSEEFDDNNEFDLSTFTVNQDGVYAINAQIKIASGLSVSTNIGLGIYKNGVLIAEENYLNVVVELAFIDINVSSPFRRVASTLKLAAGDTITFKMTSGTSIGLSLSRTSTNSFCSIYQIR